MPPCPVLVSLVLRTLLTEQCAAMPTYSVFLAVPAGQTGASGNWRLPTWLRGAVFGGFSPLAKTEYINRYNM